jgi:1-aminocyclopropane-1-carboxylate deaminase/D-cysteine desulfhydrase-like pyridoxal-dependent ACC family enzyme
MTDLTRIQTFDGWWTKRDDEAFATDTNSPSGSKVRQYATMAAKHSGLPMIVGCSASSAMQIYIAAAAKAAGVKAVVVTAGRKEKTDATLYAKRLGAKIIEVYPGGYLNVIQAKAREYAKKHFKAGYVHWSEEWALKDARDQVFHLPAGVKRIVIPTGSGLTCIGVLAGLMHATLNIPVLAVTVSPMASAADMRKRALVMAMGRKVPPLKVVQVGSKYDQWKAAILPDGTPLDPFYAAKALPYVKAGDMLWLPGVRPLSAMPVKCQEAIKELQDHNFTAAGLNRGALGFRFGVGGA